MKRVAIIPARGGSKRIPGKNIIDFCGKPMVAWTIEAALKSGCFDQILVSTDSEEIAEVSIAAGASVPFLRQENADDAAASSTATISALKQAETHWKTRFGRVAQLMPNCPLRDAEHIRAAMDNFHVQNIEYQISCFRFGWMNPWWAVKLDGDRVPTRLFPDEMTRRSQDLEQLYCPTGAIWIAGRDALLEAGTFYGPDHRYYPMDWVGAVDIDDMDDYRMALVLARMRREGGA
ncbi:MAG: acylneuraminate cytidylyltransferase family protein [Halothiobacillaceae bacterium]|nr:acylneuraminate cytidylyltransferase family protein [Halothiobacillaceae bacterium]